MKKYIAIGLCVLMLAGCNNPKSQVIPTDEKQWDQLNTSMQRLNKDDQKLLTAYLLRQGVDRALGGEGVPKGITIGQAIEAQENWQAQQMSNEQTQAK